MSRLCHIDDRSHHLKSIECYQQHLINSKWVYSVSCIWPFQLARKYPCRTIESYCHLCESHHVLRQDLCGYKWMDWRSVKQWFASNRIFHIPKIHAPIDASTYQTMLHDLEGTDIRIALEGLWCFVTRPSLVNMGLWRATSLVWSKLKSKITSAAWFGNAVCCVLDPSTTGTNTHVPYRNRISCCKAKFRHGWELKSEDKQMQCGLRFDSRIHEMWEWMELRFTFQKNLLGTFISLETTLSIQEYQNTPPPMILLINCIKNILTDVQSLVRTLSSNYSQSCIPAREFTSSAFVCIIAWTDDFAPWANELRWLKCAEQSSLALLGVVVSECENFPSYHHHK